MKIGQIANWLIASGFGLIFGFLLSWGYINLLVYFYDSATLMDVLFIILALMFYLIGFLLIYFRRGTIGGILIVTAVVLLACIILRFVGLV